METNMLKKLFFRNKTYIYKGIFYKSCNKIHAIKWYYFHFFLIAAEEGWSMDMYCRNFGIAHNCCLLRQYWLKNFPKLLLYTVTAASALFQRQKNFAFHLFFCFVLLLMAASIQNCLYISAHLFTHINILSFNH